MAKLGYVSHDQARRAERCRPRPRRLRRVLRAPPALLLRLRRERADQRVRRRHGAPRRPRGADDDRPRPAARSAWKRCARPSPTRPTPPRRWSRSTPATATSGRWSPAPTTRETQFNLAAQGHRQPGSTFKAFVLTTAIKQGIDPYSTYYTSKPLDLDLPHWGHWDVHTADEGYQGTVNLQQATVSSDNTVFAQLDLDVGPKSVAQTAKSMGITTQLDGIPAEGIGGLRLGVSPLELTDAYATLAAGGIHRDPVSIEKVTFPSGKVDRPQRPSRERVLSAAGRLGGDAPAARQHHRRDRHRRLHRLRRPGRQDRDHRRIHRRLVRRLPAQPGDGGLGRLPGVQRRLDVQRPRDHRLRRHLPGRNLALALLQRRRPLRGIRANPSSRSAGRPTTATSPRRARATTRDGGASESDEPPPPGSAAVGGYDPTIRPRRLRARRRPGTGAAATAAARRRRRLGGQRRRGRGAGN